MAPVAPFRPHDPDIFLRLPLWMQKRLLFSPGATAGCGRRAASEIDAPPLSGAAAGLRRRDHAAVDGHIPRFAVAVQRRLAFRARRGHSLRAAGAGFGSRNARLPARLCRRRTGGARRALDRAARLCAFVPHLCLRDRRGSRVLCNTVRHVALAEASAISLLLPLLLAAMLCACFGGQAVGGAARVWLWVMPVLLVIAILLQLRSFRPAWLAPVLGPGTEMLATGTVSASGWLSLCPLVWLCAEKEEPPAKGPACWLRSPPSAFSAPWRWRCWR